MPETTLRDRRRLETTRAIAEAALDLAIDRGWHDVTVDDIATAAGISRRTFFNYFPTKDEALFHLAMSWDPDLLRALETSDGPVLDALETLLVTQTENGLHDRTRGGQVMRLLESTPELLPGLLARIALVEADLTSALRVRDPARDPLEAQVLAACVGSVLRVSGANWMADTTADPVDSVRRAFGALRALNRTEPKDVP